jgi:hypothetical protein
MSSQLVDLVMHHIDPSVSIRAIVLAQLGVSAPQALARMRGYAFVEQRLLIDVARDVVSRRLQFTEQMRYPLGRQVQAVHEHEPPYDRPVVISSALRRDADVGDRAVGCHFYYPEHQRCAPDPVRCPKEVDTSRCAGGIRV